MRAIVGLFAARIISHALCGSEGSLLDDKFHSAKLDAQKKTNRRQARHEDARFVGESRIIHIRRSSRLFSTPSHERQRNAAHSFADAARTHESCSRRTNRTATGKPVRFETVQSNQTLRAAPPA